VRDRSNLPVFAHLTEGRVHEMIVAKSLNLSKGAVVVTTFQTKHNLDLAVLLPMAAAFRELF
jgi:hypothetical protein